MNCTGRIALAKDLHGDGVEFGPGVHPLPLTDRVRRVRYCDAYDRAAFAADWPELGAGVSEFPDPIDFRLHFEREPFVERIGRESLDFVVANHVLEHLVDPIRFLDQCHDLLKPGGVLFLAVPDKRAIFDHKRRRTTLEDVIARHERGEVELTDARIAEVVAGVTGEVLTPGDPADAAEFQRQRRRSLHVNVWILDDLVELLRYVSNRGRVWQWHDGALGGAECVFLLRKTARPEVIADYPMVAARLHAEAAERRADADRGEFIELREVVGQMHWQVIESNHFIRGLKRIAGVLPGAKSGWKWLKRERAAG